MRTRGHRGSAPGRALLLALAAGLLAPRLAAAAPVLEFVFLDSGRTVSPTESLEMRGRVTNVGDMALTGAVGGGSATVPPSVLDQYFDPAVPSPIPFPAGVIDLVPGESIEWLIASLVPFPISGNLGDPVTPGEYVFPLANLTTTFFVPAGPASMTFTAQTTNASDFVWTVAVPEPAAGLLLAAAGCGLFARGRRRR